MQLPVTLLNSTNMYCIILLLLLYTATTIYAYCNYHYNYYPITMYCILQLLLSLLNTIYCYYYGITSLYTIAMGSSSSRRWAWRASSTTCVPLIPRLWSGILSSVPGKCTGFIHTYTINIVIYIIYFYCF